MSGSFSYLAAKRQKSDYIDVADIEGLTTVNGTAFVPSGSIFPSAITADVIPSGTGNLPGAGAVLQESNLKVATSAGITVLDLDKAAPFDSSVMWDTGLNKMTVGTTGLLDLKSDDNMTLTVPVGKTIDLGSRCIATTPALGDNDTSVATSAFLYNAFNNITTATPNSVTITDGTNAFTGIASTCLYQTVGKTCTLALDLTWTGKGSASGTVFISNLPVDFGNRNIFIPITLTGTTVGSVPTFTQPHAKLQGTSMFLYYVRNDTGAQTLVTDATCGTAGGIYLHFTSYTN